MPSSSLVKIIWQPKKKDKKIGIRTTYSVSTCKSFVMKEKKYYYLPNLEFSFKKGARSNKSSSFSSGIGSLSV